MLNVEYPHLQLCYEDLIALQAARDADVVDRLLDPGREAFTRDLMAIQEDVEFYVLNEDETSGSQYFNPKPPPSIATVMTSIRAIAAGKEAQADVILGKKAEHDPYRDNLIAVGVIDALMAGGLETHRHILAAISCLGLIAAQHKPSADRIHEVKSTLSRLGDDLFERPTADNVYQFAVTSLKRLHDEALRHGEEEAIAANLNTFRQRVQSKGPLDTKGRKAVDTLNRYDYGRAARRTLELVMRPSTNRRDALDEVAVMLGEVQPPVVPEPTPGYTGPIVHLPWSILPPPKPQHNHEIERPTKDEPPRSREPREIIRDPLRTQWLGMLAMRWPFASEIAPVDLHSVGDDEMSEYEAAFLYGPDNVTLFAGVAETAIAVPHNGLHVAIEARLKDEQGRPVSVSKVLGGGKTRAIRHGSRMFAHKNVNVYHRATNYLTDAFQAQYGVPLTLKDAE